MRRFFLLTISLILILPFISLSQGPVKKTRITGQFQGKPGFTEISLRVPNREATVITASPIDPEGKFSLEFDLADPNLFRLYVADNNVVMLVIYPGDELKLKLDPENMGLNPQVMGSKETSALWDFSSRITFYAAGIDSVETAWKESQQKQGKEADFNFLRERYVNFDTLQKKAIKEYITANPSSLTCLIYIDKLDIEEHFDMYELVDRATFQTYLNNPFVQDFHRRVESARSTAMGSIAPEIKLPDPEGVEKSLSSLRGKIVLIDFWAAWCGPCRKENPHVLEVYKKYNSKGFEVFGVSLDRDAAAWKKAINDDGLIWNQVSDLKYWKSEAAKIYGVSAIPHTILIDREGKIIGKKLRGETLSKKLEEIFGF